MEEKKGSLIGFGEIAEVLTGLYQYVVGFEGINKENKFNEDGDVNHIPANKVMPHQPFT